MLKEYDDQVRLVMKDFPLPRHVRARRAHEAARCAAAAGKYWGYHRRLFDAQPAFERDALIEYAVELGLERDEFARCLDQRRFGDAIDADVAQARALGVNRTPTFFINGQALIGAHPVENFRIVINDALRRRGVSR